MSPGSAESRATTALHDPAQPLRVVVTRAEAADGPLSSELRNLGLTVLLWPAVAVEMTEKGPLEDALSRAGSFSWIVFASRHAVAAVTQILPTSPPGVRVAAVGQATATVLRQRGWPVDLLPAEANAAALVEAFAATVAAARTNIAAPQASAASAPDASRATAPNAEAATPQAGASAPARDTDAPTTGAEPANLGLKGSRILFPASSRALPTIAAGLTQLGAEVVQVEAYRTESSAALDVEDCRSWISRGSIGAVTFASPSAVDELEHALGKSDFDRLLSTATPVAIGPTTARALTDRGHTPALAESATLHSLAQTTHRLMQTQTPTQGSEAPPR